MVWHRAAQPANPPPYTGAYSGVRPSSGRDFNLGEAIMRCIASLAETEFERISAFRGYARGFNLNALKISGAR